MAPSPIAGCVPSTFNGLTLFGADILSVHASLVSNYSVSVPAEARFIAPATELVDATFCNVTVSYTHPGQNDDVTVEAWLPESEEWNERLQAVGGGGYVAGRFALSYGTMSGALADGYATITTDAGLGYKTLNLGTGLGGASDPSPWALLSPGNVNLYKLNNLGSTSLNDEAIIGKQLIKKYYGRTPKYSYWNGCSQGGRQGMVLAQRYPDAYDGIAAGAPAIHFTELSSSIQWAQQVMNDLGQYPHSCELDALTAAAVIACDAQDGAEDGIVSRPKDCLARFDPFQLVGKAVNCTETSDTVKISEVAAAVANATWHGPRTTDGKQLWYGFSPGTTLTGNGPKAVGQPGVAITNCTSGTCTGEPNILGTLWLELFVQRDPDFDVGSLTHEGYDQLFHAGQEVYRSVLNTDDPDLRPFKKAGGKLITFHGIDDNLIPIGGTEDYYNAVTSIIPDVQSFYKFYPVPGLYHCIGGRSGQPTSLFEQLRAWVENGTEPNESPVKITDKTEKVQSRILCPYPQAARVIEGCGDVGDAKCWTCAN